MSKCPTCKYTCKYPEDCELRKPRPLPLKGLEIMTNEQKDREIERLTAALRLIHAETKDGVAFNIARRALTGGKMQ